MHGGRKQRLKEKKIYINGQYKGVMWGGGNHVPHHIYIYIFLWKKNMESKIYVARGPRVWHTRVHAHTVSAGPI